MQNPEELHLADVAKKGPAADSISSSWGMTYSFSWSER